MTTKKPPVRLTAKNMDTGVVVAHHVRVASGRMDRAVGLLTRSRFEPGEGLLITPCRGVHTCGMRFTIDVLTLSDDGIVVDAVAGLAPWRIRLPRAGGANVLELPEGSLERSNTRIGHQIALLLAPAWEAR